MECAKKEDFSFEGIGPTAGLETESPVGKVAAQL